MNTMTKKILNLTLCLCVVLFTSCSSDDDGPQAPLNITIEGAAVAPQVGGPNQQNQVYIDLSTNTTTTIQRDNWDLGFYSGNEFRVVINGSIAMAVAELSITDIDAISSSTQEVIDLQPQVAVGTFDSSNIAYVDAFNGNINATAIELISDTDSENNVYLVNLGNEVGTDTPATGSVALDGESRGWLKLRVLQNGVNYILQYADLDDTTHHEVTINKDVNYNFTFFSFNTETIVNVEPESTNWDLNFTVFTDEVFAGPDSYGAYIYADFVASNNLENVGIYKIDTDVDAYTYDDFSYLDIDNSSFSNDQRGIGSSWRNGGGPGSLPSLKENVFYIVNDANGNYYKLKFLALTNPDGDRGYPEFVYSLLEE